MGKGRSKVLFRKTASTKTLSSVDKNLAIDLLSRMIARSVLESCNYPIPPGDSSADVHRQLSGPVAAAAEVTGAPPVNAAGLENDRSVEHEEHQPKGCGESSPANSPTT